MRYSIDQYFRQNDASQIPHRQGHHKAREDGIATECGSTVVTCDFPYDEIDQRLGNVEPVAPRDKQFHDAADLLEAIAVWLADAKTISSAGLRAVALAWVLRPRAFEEGSLWAVAKRLGCTRQGLQKYTAQIHYMSHGLFTSGTMRLPEFREERRKMAIDCHKRKGHKLRRKK